jgi:uncharacterized membrane protein YdjX (TVP38/TMEM64 family)
MLSNLIQSAVDAGPVAFFLLNAIASALVVVPSAPLNLAAGVFYGWGMGTAVFVLSTTVGAVGTVAFVRFFYDP